MKRFPPTKTSGSACVSPLTPGFIDLAAFDELDAAMYQTRINNYLCKRSDRNPYQTYKVSTWRAEDIVNILLEFFPSEIVKVISNFHKKDKKHYKLSSYCVINPQK